MFRRGLISVLLLGVSLYAQDQNTPQHMHMHMPGMNMPAMNTAGMFLMNLSSGTAVNPAAWPMPMIMKPLRSWTTTYMAQAFINDTQQSGPRGEDKFFSTNWFMANAEHQFGKNGAFQVQLMLSLEPATVTDRRYPLLFQTGETAFGKPIVDGSIRMISSCRSVFSMPFRSVKTRRWNSILRL